ncbi:alpha/beta hydrolase [Demequina lutea]|uniref:Enterochelin esterase-like enzyme n=1 Tax=Demequina lutea TaxID=431489 RepID=A0A7Y9ZBF7_9MICO|nr:alpha/beta hydrolase-fold protein [Demequina lutea]NYI40271.1 enterochelin esterase-like enzyme [Demequina lutea]
MAMIPAAAPDLTAPRSLSLPPAIVDRLADGTDLLATWWPFAAAVAAAVALVVLAVRWRRRKGRAVLTVLGSVVAAIVSVALGVNAWSGYAPSLDGAVRLVTDQAVAATATSGGLTPESIPMPRALNMPASTTWVYTPPGYRKASAVRYPTLVLIHGSPGTSADWSVGGALAHTMDVLINEGLIQPMIVVMPEVNGFGLDQLDTECLDSTTGGPQVETYLTDVVVPWVDAHYATAATWESRAIGGMSAGAFCAVDQGLRHPELYGAIISLEGYDNPGEGARGALATNAEFLAHSPGVYVDTMTFEHPVATFFGTSGNGDAGDRNDNVTLAAKLTARGQDVVYRNLPNGFHTWHTARELLPYALVFISGHLKAGGAAG